MKTKNIIILGALAVASLTTVTSCNDFEDINKDPNKADLEQVEPEWFLNGSIGDAQMNPEIAERIFILYWKLLVLIGVAVSQSVRIMMTIIDYT